MSNRPSTGVGEHLPCRGLLTRVRRTPHCGHNDENLLSSRASARRSFDGRTVTIGFAAVISLNVIPRQAVGDFEPVDPLVVKYVEPWDQGGGGVGGTDEDLDQRAELAPVHLPSQRRPASAAEAAPDARR